MRDFLLSRMLQTLLFLQEQGVTQKASLEPTPPTQTHILFWPHIALQNV